MIHWWVTCLNIYLFVLSELFFSMAELGEQAYSSAPASHLVISAQLSFCRTVRNRVCGSNLFELPPFISSPLELPVRVLLAYQSVWESGCPIAYRSVSCILYTSKKVHHVFLFLSTLRFCNYICPFPPTSLNFCKLFDFSIWLDLKLLHLLLDSSLCSWLVNCLIARRDVLVNKW